MSATNEDLRIIGLEEHAWTAELWKLLDDGSDDSITMQGRRGNINEQLCDVGAERLAQMDEAGVDMQILSIPPPATQDLAPERAVAVAREVNDFLAGAASARPERFGAFATLPLSDPDAAVDELHRSVTTLGMCGALLFPQTRGVWLDDEALRPVFEAASALRVPLYIHPQLPPRSVRDACFGGFGDVVGYALAAHGWGWHVQTGLAALRLILAGTFDRNPELQIILGHWGEMLVPFVDRVDVLSPVATSLDRRVSEYVTGNIHVTAGGIYSQRMLLDAIAAVGADRVLFASDYPYVVSSGGVARTFLDSAPISPVDKRKIGYLNAVRLLSLSAAE